YAGTAALKADWVFLADSQRGWRMIEGSQRAEDGGWLAILRPHLPGGHYLAKGIVIDYETLTGTSAVWTSEDANCCPSGGTIDFQLKLDDPDRGFELDSATYRLGQP
ncbi:MAG: hypothetical protein O7C63_02855, partial [Alphaproteobacteria bacterium]|nr:hypothetical protein [Alphaproteobacteria bacterium]